VRLEAEERREDQEGGDEQQGDAPVAILDHDQRRGRGRGGRIGLLMAIVVFEVVLDQHHPTLGPAAQLFGS
jgi:hypothetical protein